MALRVLQFAATIPAGTTKASPYTVPLALDNWEAEAIDLEVPAGPAGLMGFAVFNNGEQWLPLPAGTWLVWDNVRETWSLYGQPNASGWQIVGYNTGTYDHTITVRFHVNPPSTTQILPTAPALTFVTSEAPERPPVVL